MGPAADRRVQGDRDTAAEASRCRACSSFAGRRRTSPTRPSRGASPALHAARLALQRSRVQLEVRGRPAAIGFVRVRRLDRSSRDDLFVGRGPAPSMGGPLFRFNLTGNRRDDRRRRPAAGGPGGRQHDKYDMTESESLLIGRDFGIVTDIETGPNGNLYHPLRPRNVVYEVLPLLRDGRAARCLAGRARAAGTMSSWSAPGRRRARLERLVETA